MNILVVEDDPLAGNPLLRGLAEARHQCVWVANGAQALEQVHSRRFDAIVLDPMLPDLTGLSVLRRFREEGIQAPVVVVTALGSLEQRVAGLKAGADDYLVKPFALIELLARIEAVSRRGSARPASELRVGRFVLHPATCRVNWSSIKIELTPTEFRLLEILLRHAGQVVSRKLLAQHVWRSDGEVTTNVIEVHINRLRKKLERRSGTSLIRTIRGRGYSIDANEDVGAVRV